MVLIGDITQTDESVQLPSPKVVRFTRDTSLATGTQAVSGVGFRPSAIIFIKVKSPSTGTYSVGFDDLVTPDSVFDTHNVVADSWEQSFSFSLVDHQGSSIVYNGLVQSFDADGFTISWARVGATTGITFVKALCFK